MATNLTSTTVAAGEDILATDNNELRADVIKNAGDYETGGGTGDVITLAIDAQYVAYAAGDKIRFQASAANTGAVTINVNSLGAKAIKKNISLALIANDIVSGQEIELTYDGTNFQMLSPISNFSGSKLELDTSQVTIASSTTETSLGSFTLTGGLLSTNNGVKIDIPVSQVQVGVGNATTLIIRLKYGATTLVSITMFVNVGSGQGITPSEGYIRATLLASGGTATQKGILEMLALSQDNENKNFSGTVVNQLSTGTATEDSTGDLTFEVTAQFNNNHASNNITTEAFIATLIK